MVEGPLASVLNNEAFDGLTAEEIVSGLSDDAIYALLSLEAAERNEAWRRIRYEKFKNLYPDETFILDDGQQSFTFWARRLYQRHLLAFKLGAIVRARTFMAANRVGKTFGCGGYESTCHLTGLYPEWWEGARFRHPIRAWACGKTNETTRDIVQTVLLGDIEFDGPRKVVDGSGLIPHHLIGLGHGQITWKQGVADLIDTIKIKHVSGGWSKLGIKSYAQGRGAFEGVAQHFVWDDEEPPIEIYGEQVIRTATTKGKLLITYTPLEGMTEVVEQFLPDDEITRQIKAWKT